MSGTTIVPLSQEQLDQAVDFANTQAERSSEIALKTAVIAVALIGGGVALAILCPDGVFHYVGLGTALIPGVTFASISGYHKLDSLGYQKLQKLKNKHSLEVFQQVVASYEETHGKHPIKWGYFNSERVDDLSEEIARYLSSRKNRG